MEWKSTESNRGHKSKKNNKILWSVPERTPVFTKVYGWTAATAAVLGDTPQQRQQHTATIRWLEYGMANPRIPLLEGTLRWPLLENIQTGSGANPVGKVVFSPDTKRPEFKADHSQEWVEPYLSSPCMPPWREPELLHLNLLYPKRISAIPFVN